ncbi:hypothetical protein DL93DRAFT_105697 [Clavulina sp. PMI_390]|nr:hypothetical protein DL93DRAFT_105697 [Clavulina sp. PMI_390]
MHFVGFAKEGWHVTFGFSRRMRTLYPWQKLHLLVAPTMSAKQHNATLPFLSLPNELLAEIFSLPIPVFAKPVDGPRGTEWSISEYKQYRLALSSACSALFHVITNTPQCWSFVDVCSSGSQERGFTHPSSLWIQLERSNPIPFDLAIRESDPDDEETPTEWLEILSNILQPHLSRCRSIALISAIYDMAPIHYLVSDAELPMLEHLSYHWVECYDDDIDVVLPSILPTPWMNTPLLSLYIHDTALRREKESPSLHDFPISSLSSLRRLSLNTPLGIHTVINLLRECHALEHLH